MYRLIMLMLCFTLAACCPKPPPVPTTEEGMAREAEMLVKASLMDRLMADTETYYRNQLGAFLADRNKISPADAEIQVDKAMQPLLATEEQRLLDKLVPVYRRFYTPEEIHELLSFYQTEVARKSLRVSAQIAAESRDFVRLWNENFEKKLLEQLSPKN